MKKRIFVLFTVLTMLAYGTAVRAAWNDPHDIGVWYKAMDGEENVSFTLQIGHNEFANELMGASLYMAEYNDDGTLRSVAKDTCTDGKNGTVVLSAPMPETDNYRYMVWDKKMRPLLEEPLDNIKVQKAMEKPVWSSDAADIEAGPAVPDLVSWFGLSWDDVSVKETKSDDKRYYSAQVRLNQLKETEKILLNDFVALMENYGFKLELTENEEPYHYFNQYSWYGSYEQILHFTYTGDNADEVCFVDSGKGTHFSIGYLTNYMIADSNKYTDLTMTWGKGLTVVDTGDRRESAASIKPGFKPSEPSYVDEEPENICLKPIKLENIPKPIKGAIKEHFTSDGATYDMEEYDQITFFNSRHAIGTYYAYTWFVTEGSDLVILDRDGPTCAVYAKGGTGTVKIKAYLDETIVHGLGNFENLSYKQEMTINIKPYTGNSQSDIKTWQTCPSCQGSGSIQVGSNSETCPTCGGNGMVLR